MRIISMFYSLTAMYDSIGLPPTPPSSSNSDSEGSVSPQRSAPPSPIRHSQMLRQHVHTQHTLGGASAALAQQPLFSSPVSRQIHGFLF